MNGTAVPKTAVMEARQIFQDTPDLLFDKEVNELIEKWQADKDSLDEIRRGITKGLFAIELSNQFQRLVKYVVEKIPGMTEDSLLTIIKTSVGEEVGNG